MNHSPKPKILFVGAFPPSSRKIYGGMVTACQALLDSSLPELVDLILVDTTQISNPAPNFMIRLILALRRLVIYIYKFEVRRPDCVWLFASLGGSLLEKGFMAFYARARGVPSVMFPRGGELMKVAERSMLQRFWIKLAFSGASKMVCQGKAWQTFATEIIGSDLKSAPIIENWTAKSSLLKIGSSRKERELPYVPRLLFVGWLEKEKGIFDLLEACGIVSKNIKFFLEIVGSGSQFKQAQEVVKSLGLGDFVSFSGWLEGVNLERAYARSDVLVLPSWAEGFPNVVVEALSCKMAVIVTSVGVVPDILTDGRDALIVPPKDVPSLVLAIERLISDETLRETLATNGNILSSSNWGVEKAVSKLLQISGLPEYIRT